jgi:hypothetical protein
LIIVVVFGAIAWMVFNALTRKTGDAGVANERRERGA